MYSKILITHFTIYNKMENFFNYEQFKELSFLFKQKYSTFGALIRAMCYKLITLNNKIAINMIIHVKF